MLIVIFLLICAGCAAAVYRWRWGVFAAIAMALIQDPLRKMVPGVPGYLSMCSVPIWFVTLWMASVGGELSASRFLSSFPKLARWMVLFGFYLVVPAVISFSYGQGTWQITLLGATVYSAAFFVLIAGWNFPASGPSIRRILMFYALCASVLFIGGPLDYFGLAKGWPMVGTEAMNMVWLTARTGEVIYMYAGFFRSPDVMGWHASMVVMIAGLLAIRSRGWIRWVWVGVSIWAFLNLWICGRRKMIFMLPIFWATLLWLIYWFRSARRALGAAALLLLIIGAGWYSVASTYRKTTMDTFYGSVTEDWEERVVQHGMGAVMWTVKQVGFFGCGLGMGQQGVHLIRADKPRLWQEGGPGKVVAELGVPGGVLFLYVGAILMLTAYHVTGLRQGDLSFYTCAGIFSILVSNVASSVVSAQIFGDFFIILFLVFLLGLLLSGVRNREETFPDKAVEEGRVDGCEEGKER